MGKLNANHKGHFFASSFAEWRVGQHLDPLIRKMNSTGYEFAVIWVPLPLEAHYKIDNYVPDVEGCILIAEYLKKK